MYQQWASLGDEERHAFASASCKNQEHDPPTGDVAIDPADLPKYFQSAPWDPGDDDWPVSAQALKMLQDTCGAARADGFARKMDEVRWNRKGDLLIDDGTMIDERAVFQHRFSCGQKHPGLCIRKDHAVYDECLRLGLLLEASFTGDRLRRFFRITSPIDGPFAPPPRRDLVIFFSHKRTRRQHAQVTHVWVLVQSLADGDFALCQRTLFCYDFLNSWTLAKLILERVGAFVAEDEHYTVQLLRNVDKVEDRDGSFTLHATGETFALAKPPSKPRAEKSQLDMLNEKVLRTRAPLAPDRRKVNLVPPMPPDLLGPLGIGMALPHVEMEEVVSEEDGSIADESQDDEPPDRPSRDPPPRRRANGPSDGGIEPPSSVGGASSSGGPAPAPLDQLAVVAVPAAGPPVARARNEVRVDYGLGYLLKNNSGKSLDAHCLVCGLAVNRKWTAFPRAKSLKTRAQGRPMGLLLAVLDVECDGDQNTHRSQISLHDHADRLAHRLDGHVKGGFEEMFEVERDINEADDQEEPIEIP